MRSAELVGVAQPIACCGKVSGEGRRGEITERRMRTPAIVVVDPTRNCGSCVVQVHEQGLVEEFGVDFRRELALTHMWNGPIGKGVFTNLELSQDGAVICSAFVCGYDRWP